MHSIFEWIDRGLTRLMMVMVFASTTAILCLITFLVLCRFVFGWSVVGMLELSTLSALWLYMVGAVLASRNREHITVDFISQTLRSPRLTAAHDLAISLILLGLGLFFLSLARDMVAWSLHRPQVTPGLGIPLIAGQAAIVTAAALGLVYTLRDIVKATAALIHPKEEV